MYSGKLHHFPTSSYYKISILSLWRLTEWTHLVVPVKIWLVGEVPFPAAAGSYQRPFHSGIGKGSGKPEVWWIWHYTPRIGREPWRQHPLQPQPRINEEESLDSSLNILISIFMSLSLGGCNNNWE